MATDRIDGGDDESRDEQVRRVVDRVARHTLKSLGWEWDGTSEELGIAEPPAPSQAEIERAAYAYDGGPALALRVAAGLLWPDWDQDCNRPQPPRLEPMVIDRALELTGQPVPARDGEYGA